MISWVGKWVKSEFSKVSVWRGYEKVEDMEISEIKEAIKRVNEKAVYAYEEAMGIPSRCEGTYPFKNQRAKKIYELHNDVTGEQWKLLVFENGILLRAEYDNETYAYAYLVQ